MKVRIGNDIRLNLTLKGPKAFDSTNIKELRCYLINTSVLDYNPLFDYKRFPEVGFCSHYGHCGMHHPIVPMEMDHCGEPRYFMEPCKDICHCKGKFRIKHDKYPYTPVDPAFGEGPLRPNYGHIPEIKECCGAPMVGCDLHMHKDKHNYCRYGHFDPRAKCHPHPCFDPFDHCFDHHPGCFDDHLRCGDERHMCHHHCHPMYHDFIAPYMDENFKFLAPSKILKGKNRIQTYFPAYNQFLCGDYKLVVVLVAYESGWGRCDLHTYTIDYGTVVTLVDDDSAVSGNVTINVDKDELEDTDITALYVANGDLYLNAGDGISLNGKDIYNNLYEIGAVFANGNYMIYNPDNWNDLENITFSVDDESVATVNTRGDIFAKGTLVDKETIVEVRVNNDSNTFKLHVLGSGRDYVGFSSSDDYRDILTEINEDDGTNFVECKNGIYGTHNVTLNGINKYLWIVSTKPIADGNSASPFWVKLSMFDVPLTADGKYFGLYYYHCPNPLSSETINGISSIDFDLTIEEK